jgi:hypothetical protein
MAAPPLVLLVVTRTATAALLERLRPLPALDAALTLTVIEDAPSGLAAPAGVALASPDAAAAAAAGFSHVSGPSAWPRVVAGLDKALFHAATAGGAAAHVWLVEDDVVWQSPADLVAFLRANDGTAGDLLATPLARTVAERPAWPNWRFGREFGFAEAELAGQFLPVCRVSRALLAAVTAAARDKGRLAFLEVLLPSLARRAGLSFGALAQPARAALRFRPHFTSHEIAALAGSTPARIFHPFVAEHATR